MQWVLIRGIVSADYHWGSFASKLASRFQTSQIETADILGNGRTRDRFTPINVNANLQGLRSQVKSKNKKIILGFSLGGMLALEWAHQHPDEVEAVVLINSSLNNMSMMKRLRPNALKTIVTAGLKKDYIEREKLILKMTTTGIAGDHLHNLAQDWGKYGLENPIKSVNFFLQLALASKISQRKTPPQAPVLILTSQKDLVVHPDCSFKLAKNWNLEPIVHDHAGHDLTLDDPDWVLDKIENWFKADLAKHPRRDSNPELVR